MITLIKLSKWYYSSSSFSWGLASSGSRCPGVSRCIFTCRCAPRPVTSVAVTVSIFSSSKWKCTTTRGSSRGTLSTPKHVLRLAQTSSVYAYFNSLLEIKTRCKRLFSPRRERRTLLDDRSESVTDDSYAEGVRRHFCDFRRFIAVFVVHQDMSPIRLADWFGGSIW